MKNQTSLTEFETPNVPEQPAYQDILPSLRAAAEEIGANASIISFKPTKNYSSIYYGKTLVFRLKLRGKTHYIEIPTESEPVVSHLTSPEQCIPGKDFSRIVLSDSAENTISDYASLLGTVLKDVINRLPKEWDCCSRYLECSNARKCIHPDPTFALGCGYRKILVTGKVFYGENRNVE